MSLYILLNVKSESKKNNHTLCCFRSNNSPGQIILVDLCLNLPAAIKELPIFWLWSQSLSSLWNALLLSSLLA